MNAGLSCRRIRWKQLAFAYGCSWFFAGACAEPATVDPARVPEASIDAGPDRSDADPDADLDASTGSGGGGTGGGGGSGGTGGSSGTGGARNDASDADDVRSEGGDSADGSDPADGGDASADAPPSDTGTPPDGPADVPRDPVIEPPTIDTGRGDTVTDATGDRAG